MRIFIVRRGDTLYSIARMFGVSVDAIKAANELNSPDRLSVGQALVIPGRDAPSREIEVNGYAYPGISSAVLSDALKYLTFISPFSWQVDAAGGITPIADERIISAAYAQGAAPLLTVTNTGTSGGFESNTAHAVLTDGAAQDTFMQNMLSALRQRGYRGVNLNFEYVYPFDRDSFNAFLERLSQELHSRGLYLVSTVAPKVSDDRQGILSSAQDYAAHGTFCDRVVIMTCEWGYTLSPPQAVSPVNRMREVLDYAVTKIPPGKILIGVSNYGYNWRLPHRQGQAAQTILNAAAQNLAPASLSGVKYDTKAQAPYFRYTDPSGVQHEVWYEDARSVKAKLKLVSEYELAGISLMTVNYPDRAGFEVLQSVYTVEKIV